MASTDIDGTKLMIIGEGQPLTLVMGDLSFRGTLQLRVDGFQESWYIKLDGTELGEIEIHKREREAPKNEMDAIIKSAHASLTGLVQGCEGFQIVDDSGDVKFDSKAYLTEFCGFESLHPAHEYDGKYCPGSEHLTQGK
jgi:hypothetical protein